MVKKNNDKYDVSFSLLNEREMSLVINAIKRQVDYYRKRVFESSNVLNENALHTIKYNYKVYCDLYDKIINDYNDIVN